MLNWKRFWYPRESPIQLSNVGYLLRPDSEWVHLFNPALVKLESLVAVPCLVLLGEPGIGKTSELKHFQTFTQNTLEAVAYWFDLHGYQTETMLYKQLSKAPVFQSWLVGSHALHLFLDGFDEGILTIPVLANLLPRILEECPISRLYLRIASRAADWSSTLEGELRRLWGEEEVRVYQLAPLRREDAAEAAVSQKLNAEQILHEVAQKDVGPLASRPLTLRFLLNTYQKREALPSTQMELYAKGCRILCEETSNFRRSTGFRGNLSSEQRMIVASRIAALTIFTNRAAVWTGLDLDDRESAITLRELRSGSEMVDGHEVIVSEEVLRETLNTGLFSSRGSELFGWAHRTYAEFLAAWYLVQHQVSLPQILSLIIHPDENNKRLVPQLHETAAWIATMRPDVFDQIMRIEPEVLLRSDVATAEAKDRAALVDALLHLQDDVRQIHLFRNLRGFYWKLTHADLSAQLSHYIIDSSANEAVRLLAIDIVEACKLYTFQQSLVNLVLDSSESQLVRTEAAHAIVHIGDEAAKGKLKTLAFGTVEDDPSDELKGYALQAVWPTHMTAAELFAVLTPARRQHFSGAYQRFLSSHFIRQLRSADLPLALKWVEERVSRGDGRYRYSILFPITDDILLESWKHLDTPGVLEALARVIVVSVERFEVIEDQENHELVQLVDDDNKRRHVLAAVLHEFSQRQSDSLLLFDYTPRLLLQRDVLWLLEHLLQAETDSLQEVVARLIGCMIKINDVDLMNTVWTVCQNNPYLAAEFSWLLQPVKLGSPEAKQMREAYLREKQHEVRLQELAQRPDSPSMEQIARLLDECEQDSISLWNRVYQELVYRPDGTAYQNEFKRDVFPGWAIADEAIRARMIEVATQYVKSFEPQPEDWLGTDHIPLSTLVVYQTLQLLMREMPSFISALAAEQWRKFVPIIFTWCVPEDVPVDRDLLKLAYRVVPDAMIQAMTLLIERQGKLSQEPLVIQKVESCWDDHLAHALLEKVKDVELALGSLECLLRTLLQHHLDEAREFALALVASPLLEEREKLRALIAAKLLLRYAEDAGWSVVWAAMQRDEDFGMKLIAKFAQSFSDWVPPQLTEDQLADFYIWLVRHYPPSQYPIVLEASFAGVADSTALWRDALLSSLKNRATFQACEAIRRISRELPELDQFSLRWTLQEAQELARRQTWEPFQPRDILNY